MNGVICLCNNCPGNEDNENSTCVLKPGAHCYSSVEDVYNPEIKEWELVFTFGCLPPDEQTLLQCQGDLVPSVNRRMIKCCNFTDYCNKDLLPPYKPLTTIAPPSLFFEDDYIISPVIICSLIPIFLAVLCLLFFRFKCRKSRREFTELCNVKVQKFSNNVQDFISTSGSGVGESLLERTTIGRQIRKERLLGKGRFSEKWIVKWKGEKIVMKTFSTLEEDQWLCETKIYLTVRGHENILRFIGLDILRDGSRAIFTDYHENSLHNHLKEKYLNDKELLALVRSAARALTCLHTEIVGAGKRPAIVHRNITSTNFLINFKKECVLSDFEVSLIDDEILDPKIDVKSGNPRYSPPEVILETVNMKNFEILKKSDVYSLGLVLWEICRRHVTVAEEYELPFFDSLPKYPNTNDLRDLFATKNPIHEILGIPASWEKNETLKIIIPVLKESIRRDPIARPSALRIAKSFKANE